MRSGSRHTGLELDVYGVLIQQNSSVFELGNRILRNTHKCDNSTVKIIIFKPTVSGCCTIHSIFL